MNKTWRLIGPDNKPYVSTQPGKLGGHRRSRIYGRLNCPTALRAIARGGYVTHRVFFLTEEHAWAAGYRPCAVCLPMTYAHWKASANEIRSTFVSDRMTQYAPTNRKREKNLHHG